MKQTKLISLLLAILILPALLLPVRAESTVGYAVTVEPETIAVGDEVTVRISLENYTIDTEEGGIRGLQIDITNIDTSVVTPVSQNTLIEDDSAFSNEASYNESKKLMRLMYVTNNTLPETCTDVFEIKLRINESLTVAGSITLPITIKYQMSSGTQTVVTDEVVIQYTAQSEPDYSVDVSWGDLAYTYTDGTWNVDTHTYSGGGWTVNTDGGDQITVTNNGAAEVTATLTYTKVREEITGSFDKDQLTVAAGTSATATLSLTGKPSADISNEHIGTVTVTLN